MCTNFRETLDEQLKIPEFAAAWEASEQVRREVWFGLLQTGEERARSRGLLGEMVDACAHGFAVGCIDQRELYAINALERGYSVKDTAYLVDLPIEWVRALAKADLSKVLNFLTLTELYEDPESHFARIRTGVRPTLIRDSGGSDVVAMGWDQYQAIVREVEEQYRAILDALEPLVGQEDGEATKQCN